MLLNSQNTVWDEIYRYQMKIYQYEMTIYQYEMKYIGMRWTNISMRLNISVWCEHISVWDGNISVRDGHISEWDENISVWDEHISNKAFYSRPWARNSLFMTQTTSHPSQPGTRQPLKPAWKYLHIYSYANQGNTFT